MTTSAYIEWVNKYLAGLILRQVARVNDNKPLTYLHRQLLRKDFSVTGKWQSLSSTNSLVSADVVAMDSPLPLKRRGSLGSASGDIVKMGMEFQLNESQLTEIDTLIAVGGTEAQIVQALFQDLPNAITGIYERLEAMFLEGFSTGVTLVEDADNVGTAIRLDYGYLAENKFTTTVDFSDVNSNPFDQIKRMQDKAALDGQVITTIYTDPATLLQIANSNQAKQFYAFSQGFVGNAIPAPDANQLNTVAQSRFGYQFAVVDRAVRTQKNGVNTVTRPFAANTLVAVTTDQIGSYVYARLAEQNRPVAGVTYQGADDFILVSQFRKHEPSLLEGIKSQARVVPVISGVEAIYLMDTTVTG